MSHIYLIDAYRTMGFNFSLQTKASCSCLSCVFGWPFLMAYLCALIISRARWCIECACGCGRARTRLCVCLCKFERRLQKTGIMWYVLGTPKQHSSDNVYGYVFLLGIATLLIIYTLYSGNYRFDSDGKPRSAHQYPAVLSYSSGTKMFLMSSFTYFHCDH